MTTTAGSAEIGPLRHDIDARWLMAYAAGLAEPDPRYYDTLAPRGPLERPPPAVDERLALVV